MRRGVCGSWGNGSHLGSWGIRPARRGKRRAVGIRQWRRIDVAGCLKTQEMGSSEHQATFMHRVCVIVRCVIITTPTNITGIVFYCIICFRKINHLVVKHHLYSSSGVREVVSSTVISQRIRSRMQRTLRGKIMNLGSFFCDGKIQGKISEAHPCKGTV